jgi:hypothetical protein
LSGLGIRELTELLPALVGWYITANPDVAATATVLKKFLREFFSVEFIVVIF